MTTFLLGGTKHKSLSPPMEDERDKKRKESEPYIDVSGLEEEKQKSSYNEKMYEKYDEIYKRPYR